MKEAKRRRGRPTVGLRVPLSLRVTPESKRKLDAAAEIFGRSQSQEAEFRIEISFERTDLLDGVLALAFGKELGGLLLMLGIAMHDQGRRVTDGKSDWTSDSVAYDAAVVAAMRLLDLGRPDGSRASSSDRDVAAEWVEELIQAINDGGAKAKEVLGDDPRGDAILRLTGPIVKKMSEALARMRGQLNHQDSRGRSSSRKAREAG